MDCQTDGLNVDPNPKIIPGKMSWPENPSFQQSFSFSSPIIYYIARNPCTLQVYSKLIQSCKYFFEENPILHATNMNKKSICDKEYICFGLCCIKIDIDRLSSKIWLTSKLVLSCADLNFVLSLRPKLYRHQIRNLGIHDTEMTFDDYKFLASAAEKVCLSRVKIFHNNGSNVELEKLIEVITNVHEFVCSYKNCFAAVSASTAMNIANLNNLRSLRKLFLLYLPETFNVGDLFDFSKARKDVEIRMCFDNNNISKEYKNKLKNFITADSSIRKHFAVYKKSALSVKYVYSRF